MSEPLATYIRDHLAGASFAIELLETMRDQHAGEPLGEFAAELLAEVQADRTVLEGLSERVGAGPSRLKGAAAWLGEKVSRLKLGGPGDDFGTFEALDVLALGILGKESLWRALAVAATADVRLQHVDFEQLAARARSQHARVEERRLEAARTALRAAGE